MNEIEISNERKIVNNDKATIREINQLQDWFRWEYLIRIEHVKRCKFLGVTPDETEYDIQIIAYKKEQRLRELTGKPKLENTKYVSLFKE